MPQPIAPTWTISPAPGRSRSFVNNNSSALAEAQERRRRTEAAAQEPQLDALHLLTLRSYKKVGRATGSG